jgi:hypothetical protein
VPDVGTAIANRVTQATANLTRMRKPEHGLLCSGNPGA